MFQRSDICQAQFHESRNFDWARFRDMAQSVAPNIAVVGGVRQLADTHAVEHDPNDSVPGGHSALLALHGLSATLA